MAYSSPSLTLQQQPMRTCKHCVHRMALAICILVLQACATSGELTTARVQFKQGSTDAALQTLSEADVSRRDRLLLLLDKALVAQAAQEYAQSIVAFEEAYQLIEQLDYISTRDQSAALATSDWAIRYSGEFSERLWIHTFQMINYLMLDQPTGAAVEARRAVALYEKHDDVLDNDLFTRYLMALSFETAGQWDSAQVEYRRLASTLEPERLPEDARRGRELILLVATGFIEPKLPGDLYLDIDARVSFPYYPDIHEQAPDISILAGSRQLETTRVDTQLLPIARSALAKRGKAIAARQALRLAVKYNVSESIEEQDPLAGALAKLFLLAIERADTRSWETLPAYLSLLRVELPVGSTSVNVSIDSEGRTSSIHQNHELQLIPDDKRRHFRMIRVGISNSPQQIASP